MERTKTGEFNWVDISAKDMEAQSAFYQALFGWVGLDTPVGNGQIYRTFYKEDHRVAGMSQLGPDLVAAGIPTAWNNYLAADDIDATAARAVELGANVAMPPTDVPGSGRMAVIQDPTGALVFFWKANNPETRMAYSGPGLLSWNDLNTRDPEKAQAFYSALLGWEFMARADATMPYWVIEVDGEGQGGMMPMPEMVAAEVPSFWMPYFGSGDVATDVAKATELGGSVLVEPTVVEDAVSFAVLTDPLGATFALMQSL
jgi:hypothetical protein